MALKKAGDMDGAIAAYTRVLERYPRMARAHLQLAMLYDQEPQEDYARAIYHYERYLELSRDDKARRVVRELLTRAQWSLGASLARRPDEAAAIIAELKKENAMLREQLARYQAQGFALASASPIGTVGTSPKPASSTATVVVARPPGSHSTTGSGSVSLPQPTIEPGVSRVQTYTVQPGDTLAEIAKKVYGDASAWRKIYEANKNILPGPGSVRPGQVLVIPR